MASWPLGSGPVKLTYGCCYLNLGDQWRAKNVKSPNLGQCGPKFDRGVLSLNRCDENGSKV